MLSEINPDEKGERQWAIGELIIHLNEKLPSIEGWERPFITKLGMETAVAKYPNGITSVTPALLNKLVQSIASLGWRIETTKPEKIIMTREGIRTKLSIDIEPNDQTPFIVKYI